MQTAERPAAPGLIPALGSIDLRAAIRAAHMSGEIGLIPLFKAGLDGAITLHEAEGADAAPAVPDLPPVDADGPYAAVLVLSARDTPPEAWRGLQAVQQWGQTAYVHADHPMRAHMLMAIRFALGCRRLVLVRCEPEVARAWADALWPMPSATVLPPPRTPAPSRYRAHEQLW